MGREVLVINKIWCFGFGKNNQITCSSFNFQIHLGYPIEIMGSVSDSLPFSSVKVKTRFLEFEELFKNRTLEEATRVAEMELNRITED